MQVPGNQYAFKANQCPHGLAPGACASCSGGGGGGGGAPKRSTAGLMSWNEAWATWNAIQTAKTREKDYLSGINAENLRRQKESTNTLQTPPSFSNPLIGNFVSQVLASAIKLFIATMRGDAQDKVGNPSIQKPINTGETLTERLNAMAKLASQRLANLVFDTQSLVSEGLRNNLEVIKSLIAQLKWETVTENFLNTIKRLFNPSEVKALLKNAKERVEEFIATVNRFFQSTEPSEKP